MRRINLLISVVLIVLGSTSLYLVYKPQTDDIHLRTCTTSLHAQTTSVDAFNSSFPTYGASLYGYTIVNVYPHDSTAFTEGLVFENGILYEGTGLYEHSSLRKIELETGTVLRLYQLAPQFFGEGITLCGDRLIQLTWKNHVGFVYDKETFKLIQEFNYSAEGWGITYDGKRLIMSDGTSTLHFLDPGTFKETGRVDVHDDGGSVTALNELEYVRGEIYANVWLTDKIVRISPETGRVVGWIGLKGLLTPEERANADVLNGIAYDADNNRLFVTGKLWPTLFEIRLICFGTAYSLSSLEYSTISSHVGNSPSDFLNWPSCSIMQETLRPYLRKWAQLHEN